MVNVDGKVMMLLGGFLLWGYGFVGMYDSGGYILCGQFGIVGENGLEIVNGLVNVISWRNIVVLVVVVVGMMGVVVVFIEFLLLYFLVFFVKGGEVMVSCVVIVLFV